MKNLGVSVNVDLMVVVFFAIMLMASIAVGQEHLEIYGQVLASNGELEQVDAVISDEYGEVMNIEVDQYGNFMLVVPANDVFTLKFSSPGTVGRSLILDTNGLGVIKKQKDRAIELVVELSSSNSDSPNEVAGEATFDEDGLLQFNYTDALP